MRHEKIEYKSIEELIPYARNQRIHSDEQVKKIAASIKEFGFKNPVIVDKEGTIIAGHGRCLAAEKLKIKQLPVIVADDLNDAQVKALRLADNKLQDLSEFDDELVKLELEELKGLDFDINLTGFDDLIDINALNELDDERLDEVPEAPKEPRTKQGDLYIIDGKHRVLCGDSTKEEDVKRLMGGDKADMVFTDPPYGMNLDTDFSKMKSSPFKGKTGGSYYSKVIGDSSDFKPDLISTVLDNFRYCQEIFIWGCDYFLEIVEEKNKGSWLVWDKRLNDSAGKMFGSEFELCWSKTKHKREILRVKWAAIFGMEKQDTKKRVHPTQKPIELVTLFFKKWGKGKLYIIDLYLGSGTTLIACEKTNRKCYGIEIDPIYCDVIIQRYKDLKPEAKIELNGEAIDW